MYNDNSNNSYNNPNGSYNNPNNNFNPNNGYNNPNNGYNNGFSNGPQYRTNPYYQRPNPLALNALEVGRRLKKIFWLLISTLIAAVVFAILLVFSSSAIVLSYMRKSTTGNYSPIDDMSGLGFFLFLCIALIIFVLVFFVLYLVFLFGLNAYERSFGIAATLTIVSFVVSIATIFLPGSLRLVVKLILAAMQVGAGFLFWTGIYNSVRKIDPNRAAIVGVLRIINVVVSSATGFLSFITSLDTSGTSAGIYFLVSLVGFGVSIWQIVEIWRSASFLQRYGEANRLSSYSPY